VALVAAGTLATCAGAAAEPLSAELRTWDGQTWQLADVTVVTFHSVPAPAPAPEAPPGPAEALAALAAPAAAGPARSASGPQNRASGARLGDAGPEPLPDPRATRYVTLYRAGVATRVDLEQVTTLVFFRHPIADSQLPPYVRASHVRHAAVAILADGSRVDGDEIGLGSTEIRGRAFGTQVAIPWTSIELLRFGR
jgi:hypothetical protein